MSPLFSTRSRTAGRRTNLSRRNLMKAESNGIFVGKALVDAHRFGEDCDWTGFVLCPSAFSQIEKLNLPAIRPITFEKYKLWGVPTKKRAKTGVKPSVETIIECSEELHALLYGAYCGNGRDFMSVLNAMSSRTNSPKDKVKYANSIQFLSHFDTPK